jgi:hypothetical protein
MRAIELLRQLADDLCARGVGQALELAQVFVQGLACASPLDRRTDEQRALGRSGDGDQVA